MQRFKGIQNQNLPMGKSYQYFLIVNNVGIQEDVLLNSDEFPEFQQEKEIEFLKNLPEYLPRQDIIDRILQMAEKL